MGTGPIDAHLAALANCPVFGSRSMERLFARFLTAKTIWEADQGDFTDLDIPAERLKYFFSFRQKAEPEKFAALLTKFNIRLLTKDSPEYPPDLKTIFDPPFVLFVRGAELRGPFISIVGSRKCSEYGQNVCTDFSQTLARSGVNIVSGLALGIDTIAHTNALAAGGATVAVLGGGLLAKNPMDTSGVSERMLAGHGTLITEFSLFSPFLRYHFPMRNRIIAGMSKATLVIEAALPSGSLITAKEALESGRDVFAVPGAVTSKTSAGTNHLIKDGALVATSPDDILLYLNLSIKPKNVTEVTPKTLPPQLSELSKSVYKLLSSDAQMIDTIITISKLSVQQVSCALIELEILKLVEDIGGKRYRRL